MIVYFSGTGNSRFVADFLAHQLDEFKVDAGAHIKAGKRGVLQSDRPWIFVAPTYAWQLPHIFQEYLLAAELSGNQNAYFVLTCGSDIGNAGEGAAALCKEKGLHYCGILEVIMPENYIAMFPIPSSKKSDRIIRKAIPGLLEAAAQIRLGAPFPIRKANLFDRLKSGFVNDIFYRKFIKADPFYVKSNCNGCGLCVKVCPLNNIDLIGSRPVWGTHCTHCMACICGCPAEAIEYGKHSRKKPRYQCPTYQK